MDEHHHGDVSSEQDAILQAQVRSFEHVKAAFHDPELAQKLPLACELVRDTWRNEGPHDLAHPEQSWTDPRGYLAACMMWAVYYREVIPFFEKMFDPAEHGVIIDRYEPAVRAALDGVIEMSRTIDRTTPPDEAMALLTRAAQQGLIGQWTTVGKRAFPMLIGITPSEGEREAMRDEMIQNMCLLRLSLEDRYVVRAVGEMLGPGVVDILPERIWPLVSEELANRGITRSPAACKKAFERARIILRAEWDWFYKMAYRFLVPQHAS
jgi:hypothetical protein